MPVRTLLPRRHGRATMRATQQAMSTEQVDSSARNTRYGFTLVQPLNPGTAVSTVDQGNAHAGHHTWYAQRLVCTTPLLFASSDVSII